jgi:hypothetical protein
MISQTKCVLHLRQIAHWHNFSATRCCATIHLGRPILSEPIDHDSPWREIVATTGENFIQDALAFVPRWEEEYARQLTAAREKLPASVCWGNAIAALP